MSPAWAKQYVFPAAGQSPEQQARDEQACHQWAVQQTGYDPYQPAQPAPATGSSNTGRNVVRGGAKGALAGWAIGAVAGGDRSDAVVAGALLGGVGSGIKSSREQQKQQQAWSAQQSQQADQYARARAACLEAKHYTVK